VVSLFGANLASSRATAQGDPLPTQLAGTSVTVNGAKAPLFFVSPTQINLQLPWETPFSFESVTVATIIVTTPAGSSAPVTVPVSPDSPSLFSFDGSGCGQAAVLNISPDGTVSVNSPSNSAAPGDFVSLFGTGFGLVQPPPADGAAATFPVAINDGGVILDGKLLSKVSYAGLAPTLVGVDQINFQIPLETPERCAVPVALAGITLSGPTLSISVHSGRGKCVDPPAQSYGTVTLTKMITSAASGAGTVETLSASFPSGPGLQLPQPVTLSGEEFPAVLHQFMSRSCRVNGNAELSAGEIRVQANGISQTVAAGPTPSVSGVEYQQVLPNGFVAPGQYAISASGAPVSFQGTMTIPSPIQVQPSLAPGTIIPNTGQPFTVSWAGASPGLAVRVSLSNGTYGSDSSVLYGVVDASAGSFTFQPVCDNFPVPVGCTLGMASSNHATVVVEVSPLSGYATAESGQGITGNVELSWMYRYVFSDLVLK
jgi:uncharacterized protein (TIGR03437 family)